jgi:hypothetical protein
MLKNLTVICIITGRNVKNVVFPKLGFELMILLLHRSKLVLILPIIQIILELHISINTKTRNITGVSKSDILETVGSKRRAEQL